MEGWTSLSVVSFIALADKQFDKTLSLRLIMGLQTLADLGPSGRSRVVRIFVTLFLCSKKADSR